jgi:hypothetical protein
MPDQRWFDKSYENSVYKDAQADYEEDGSYLGDAPYECPLCGGEGEDMGSLGAMEWYRCRQCGADFSVGVVGEQKSSQFAPTRERYIITVDGEDFAVVIEKNTDEEDWGIEPYLAYIPAEWDSINPVGYGYTPQEAVEDLNSEFQGVIKKVGLRLSGRNLDSRKRSAQVINGIDIPRMIQEARSAGATAATQRNQELIGGGAVWEVFDADLAGNRIPGGNSYTMHDVCGFAWIHVPNGRDKVVQAMKKVVGEGNQSMRASVSKAYGKTGYDIRIYDMENHLGPNAQYMSVQAAAYRAALQVLQRYGLGDARVETRMD